jgi:hypothetical protein
MSTLHRKHALADTTSHACGAWQEVVSCPLYTAAVAQCKAGRSRSAQHQGQHNAADTCLVLQAAVGHRTRTR